LTAHNSRRSDWQPRVLLSTYRKRLVWETNFSLQAEVNDDEVLIIRNGKERHTNT
jgi:hypothetical protein